MSLKINQRLQGFNSFFADLKCGLLEIVKRRIEEELEREVSQWLYREYHERRIHVQRQTQAICQKCGSHSASQFMRNGHRKRQMVTTYGVVVFWMPRVVCDCGGSVKIPFSILRPYQQIWEDLLVQIDRWAKLGLSLRQMQGEIADQSATQVGLGTLTQQIQQVKNASHLELRSVPPVVMLDAIWLTLLEDSGQSYLDGLERERAVKRKRKVCVLIAVGVYPQTGRWGVLDWLLAEEESKEAWQNLLVPLENRGLYRQRGLELFIHDGGSGLIAALNYLYPNIPHQRCMFHKLRNLWHAIQAPEGLSQQDKRDFKRHIIHQVIPIFDAPSLDHAQHIRDTIVAQYQLTQSKFVDTLQRDWQDTVAFFRVLQRFPAWHRKFLRATSLLERLNRSLRQLFRPKGAFHSRATLMATVTRILSPKQLV